MILVLRHPRLKLYRQIDIYDLGSIAEEEDQDPLIEST